MFKKILLVVVSITMFVTVGNVCADEVILDVTPDEAFYMVAGGGVEMMSANDADENVFILDVRTAAEWSWVGHPGLNKLGEGVDLEGKVVNISYLIERNGEKVFNNQFLVDVRKTFGKDSNVTLITMCRSGKRSKAAATMLAAEGYDVYNMVTGFQGGSDEKGYRTVAGWAVDGLPYKASSTGAYVNNSDGNMK